MKHLSTISHTKQKQSSLFCLYIYIKSGFKRACRRFPGFCAPHRPPFSPQTRYSTSMCHMGVCMSSRSSKMRVHPPVKNLTKKRWRSFIRQERTSKQTSEGLTQSLTASHAEAAALTNELEELAARCAQAIETG